jgi:hypothetical protein
VGLYDGSAEAQQILRAAQTAVFDSDPSSEGLLAMGALTNALNYLKGRDICGKFSNTAVLLCKEADEPVLSVEEAYRAIEERVFPELKLNVEEGKAFFQQLRDKATSVEEVPFDLNPNLAETAARKIRERDEPTTS